ncbi:hypothetical protein BWQ96_09656 [Gracilariopsis chorda]|uniref:VWFA domain-containing protein n=1 Tax=Gracilariopsis chorda TaxID=448386 RepID=A0A2V3IEV7_9FLOR|nr:hypothetical protein BWQ96_09656 [Gracilariopsis chorda]|eukprot:PXF40625.1 hypothetical protein BWQ96_09656 [Gracilariopsis chorda]
MVNNVTLRHHFPIDISLDINVPGDTQDIVMLVDASQSTRAKLNNVKEQLKSFVRTLGDVGNVSVAFYGGESDMGETGYSVALKATSDVNRAAEALDNIPIVADGPRTSITAMWSIMQHQDGTIPLGLFANRRIIVLVGDTPGREPECRHGIKSDRMSFSSQRTRVMVVNLASPGLNAALPAPAACGYITSAAIPEGQGTRLADTSEGELISQVTSSKLRESILKLRMNAANGLHGKGSHISVLSKTYTYTEYTCPSSFCARTITTKGCDDRVIIRKSNIPDFAHGPVQMTGKISLSLPAGICQRGPFYCEVEVKERLERFSYSHWSLPQRHTHLIGVKACQ